MTILNKFYSISKNFKEIDDKYKLTSNNLFSVEEQKQLLIRTSVLVFVMMLSTFIISIYLFTDPDVIFEEYSYYFQAISLLISFTISGGLLFFCLFLVYNALLINKNLLFLRKGLNEIVNEVGNKPIMVILLRELITNNVEFDDLYLILLNEKDKQNLAMNVYNLYFMFNFKINMDFNLKRRLASTNYKPSFSTV
jgi:hypothetical protein